MGREGFEPSTLGLREPSRRLGLSRFVRVLHENPRLVRTRVSGYLVPSRWRFAVAFSAGAKTNHLVPGGRGIRSPAVEDQSRW